MELFGIIFSLPFFFVAGLFGALTIRWLSKIPGSARPFKFLRIFAVIILASAVLNIILTAFVGPCRVWNFFGDTYTFFSLSIFFLTPPSLVFCITISTQGEIRGRSLLHIATLTAILCLFVVLEQYERTGKLFGIDGQESPQKACDRQQVYSDEMFSTSRGTND